MLGMILSALKGYGYRGEKEFETLIFHAVNFYIVFLGSENIACDEKRREAVPPVDRHSKHEIECLHLHFQSFEATV